MNIGLIRRDIPWLNNGVLLSITALILTSVFLYWVNMHWLFSQWITDKAYSHGFFVPLISLYLVWSKKDFLLSVPPEPSKLIGYLSVAICLLLLLIGRTGAVVQIEALSFFLMVPSCILLLYGWPHLKTLFFSILYLLLMIPWLDPILDKMHRPFQIVSAAIGTALLELKYPVYSDDLFIHLPNISMVVAKECSGINFLISVIAIGLPLVYLSQKTWSRAIIVIVIGCILTVLSNGLRIAIAGYYGHNYGPELLHGPAHIFQGWSVAWVGWIGLFVANWLFGKIPYKNKEPEYYLYERWRRNENNPRSTSEDVHSLQFHFLTLLALFFSFAVYLNFFAMPKAVTLNAPLQQFPIEINGWKGVQSDWLGEQVFFPKGDNDLSRVYHDQSGNSVYLFVGYYQKQDNEKRLVSYLSKPLHNNTEIAVISPGPSSYQVVLSSLSVGMSDFKTLFWYQFPAKLKMTDRLQVKLHVLKSSILQRQNNGAIILLATPESSVKDNDMKSIMAMQSFAADLAPLVNEFIP